MASKIVPLLVSFLLAINVADATIGINWGRQNAQRLLPSNVVDLFLQNQIRHARIFSSEEDMLRAFFKSEVHLTVTISYSHVVDDDIKSNSWVQMRIPYFNASNIRRIYVADYVFAMGSNNKALINDAIETLQSLQKVLNYEGYGDQIKVTIPHHRGILKINNKSLRPSEAEFLDEIKPEMTTFLRILQQNDAPFVVTITTIGDVQDLGVDFNFAFADNKSTLVITDVNGAVYTNLFEIMYDSFIWALNKLNASDLRVIVGQVGWPTDGYPGANASTAERYYKSLLPFVSSNGGTPMRPGAPIDIYIHSLTDENRMPVSGNATFTRHMGIYMSNGKPKYKIDLSGQGRDIYPAEGKGIMRMPDRWCMFNDNRSDIAKLKKQIDKACSMADCTAMAPGGSCSRLGYPLNVSYAFNMHFQFQYQNETECDFEGLGQVSTVDPSTPECVFPVEVVRPEPRTNFAGKGLHEKPNSTVFVILFSILGTLFLN
ncbi:hypothetical protein ACS0TY_024888 [Phlomoides rotata]